MNHEPTPRRMALATLALGLLVAGCATTGPECAGESESAGESEQGHAAVDTEEGARAEAGDLLVKDAWMPEPANPEVGAIYLSVTNGAEDDDALVSVSTDASPEAEMHLTETTESGASVMREVEEIPVPAGETTALESGGFHLMVNDIPEPLVVGDSIVLTLGFESQTEVELDVVVREMTGGAHEDHSDH